MNDFNPDWICTCGDLTTLGVVHRKDGPCYYPTKYDDLAQAFISEFLEHHIEKIVAVELKQYYTYCDEDEELQRAIERVLEEYMPSYEYTKWRKEIKENKS